MYLILDLGWLNIYMFLIGSTSKEVEAGSDQRVVISKDNSDQHPLKCDTVSHSFTVIDLGGSNVLQLKFSVLV